MTRRQFLEEKWRFDREPWGSKSTNVKYQVILEQLRKMLVADGYKGATHELYEQYRHSKSSDLRDEVKDMMLEPETDDYHFSVGSNEFNMYQQNLAAMHARYGNK